jgi:5-methylcytosine-specific restriction endonuclease McrA
MPIMTRVHEFSLATKRKALERQKHRCASCGETITTLENHGRTAHRFGEAARAHHVLHIQQGGTNEVANCVILCESCHYSVHEGGFYRSKAVIADKSDYPHYDG